MSILQDGQVLWNGLLMGEGTSYGLTQIDGWLDLPDVNDYTQSRPREHGDFSGSMWAKGRVVQLSGLYYGSSFDSLHRALMNASALSQNYSELRVNIHNQELTAQARLTRRSLPVIGTYGYRADKFALQLRCPDPRRYEDTAQLPSIGLPVVSGGLAYPLTYPLNYGTTTNPLVTFTNAGNADSFPIFIVKGPLQGFTLIDTSNGRELDFIDTVGANDVVTIDMQKKQVSLNGNSNRRASLTTAQWWSLGPGETATMKMISTGTYSSAASLAVQFRNAWW